MADNVLEVDVENEQVVLAAFIKDHALLKARGLKIMPERFLAPKHRDIMRALRTLVRGGGAYAADTIVSLSGGSVTLKYLRELEDNFDALPPENLNIHLKRLDAARAKASAAPHWSAIYEGMEDPHTELGEIKEHTAGLLRILRAAETEEEGGLARGEAFMNEWLGDLKEMRERKGALFAPLHFSGLDDLLFEGLKPGNLTVIAARPGMGKTTFCSNLTLRQTLRGRRVLSIPVESGKEAVLEQMICARARVSAGKLIKTPHLISAEEVFRLTRAAREILADGRLAFDDRMLNLDELEARVEAEQFDVVIVDLFEYLVPGEKKAEILTDNLRRIRRMGKRFGFHSIVTQQIRRIKRMKNPRPLLHELKNSGGYEEVADLVLLMHRSKYYNPDAEEDIMEVRLAKQRRGPMNLVLGYEFAADMCRVGKNTTDFHGAADIAAILKEMKLGAEEEGAAAKAEADASE